MNIRHAKELLLSMQQRWDAKLPLENQLQTLFTPALIGKSIVLADSLHGRVSRILNYRKSKLPQANQIKAVFGRALKALEKDLKTAREIDLSLLVTLDRYVHAEEDPQAATAPKQPEVAALAQTAHETTERLKVEEREAHRLSLLRETVNNPTPSPITPEAFNELMTPSRGSPQFFTHFTRFLSQHTQYASKSINENLSKLAFGNKFNKHVEKQLFPEGKPLSPEELQEKMADLADNMAMISSELKPGKSWIYCGSYGAQQSGFDMLSALSKKLPKDMVDALPPILAKSLTNGSLTNPNKLVEELLEQVSTEIRQQLPSDTSALNHRFISALLHDESRELTGKLADAMPRVIKSGLESWLKQGLAGGLMEVTEDSSVRDFILWIAAKGAELRVDPNARDTIFTEIEKQAKVWIKQPVQDSLKSVDAGLSDFLHFIPEVLPHPLLKMAGVDGLFSHGELWLDISIQPNGEYTLLIYASGAALSHHPFDNKGNRVQWPLRITNIPKEKLDKDFFHRLLAHQYGTRCDKNFVSRAEDIYGGFLNAGYLEGLHQSESSDWRTMEMHGSENYLKLQMMTSPEYSLEQSVFEMRVEALLAFSQSYLKGTHRDLVIENDVVCSSFDKAVSVISESMASQEKNFPKEKIEKIRATIKDIQAAIEKFRKAQTPPSTILPEKLKTLPPAVVAIVQHAFQNNRSTIEQMQSSKATLCWALGDEVGELIDAFADAAHLLPPAPSASKSGVKAMLSEAISSSTSELSETVTAARNLVSPLFSTKKPSDKDSKKVAPQGWLRTILFNTYVRMALRGLEFAMLLAKIYRASMMVLVKPVLSKVLTYVIPQFIQDWYAAMLGVLQRRMVEITLNIILRCLMSKDDAEQLQAMFDTGRDTVKHFVQGITGTQKLGFELDKPVEAPKVEGELFELTPFVPENEQQKKPEPVKGFISGYVALQDVNLSSDPQTLSPLKSLLKNAEVQNATESEIQQLTTPVKGFIAGNEALKDATLSPFAQPIKPKELAATLKSWLQHVKALENQKSLIPDYLILQIQRLEIPKLDSPGFWDEVEDPQQCLELLSDLAFALPSMSYSESPGYFKLTKQKYGHLLVTSHSLLAMMDKLARRCPESGLGNYKTYAHSIIKWMRNEDNAHLDDPLLTERLQQLCAYLMPDIDLNNLPDINGLDTPRQDTLFSPSSSRWFTNGVIDKNGNWHDDGRSPDVQYLSERFDCPEVQLKLIAMGVDPSKLKDREKIVLMMEELNVFTRGELSVIPRSYALLRLQALLCHHLTFIGATRNYDEVYVGEVGDVKREEAPTYSFSKRELEISRKNYQGQSVVYCTVTQAPTPFLKGLGNAFTINHWHESPERYTQSQLMLKNARFPDALSHLLIGCEPSDIIPRAIAHFKKYPKDLLQNAINSSVRSCYSFGFHLFQPFALMKQLRDSPSTAFALGELFTDLMKSLANQEIDNSYYGIIELGLKVEKYCRYYAPEHMSSWPNFQKLMEEPSRTSKTPQSTFPMLYSLTFDAPEKLQQQELLKGAQAVARAAFCFNSGEEDYLTDMYLAAVQLKVLQWMPVTAQLLKDLSGRDQLIHSVLTSLNIPIAQNTVWKSVKGRSLTFECSVMEIDFLKGKVRSKGKAPMLPTELNAIRMEAAKLCDQPDQLQLVREGVFETKDKKFCYEYRGHNLPPRCTRIIDGKTYLHLDGSRVKGTPLLQSLAEGNQTFWLEVTGGAEKELRIIASDKKVRRLLVAFNEKRTKARLVKDYAEHDPKPQKVEATALNRQLKPLERFCPLSMIQCWALPGDDYLSRVEIPSYKLSFDIKMVAGEERAYSTEFPGFYLMPVQQDLNLRGLPPSLILVNAQGDKKVIVQKAQWVLAGLKPFLEPLGNFAHELNNLLSQQIEGLGNPEVYTYSVDSSGQLVSDDPEALAYWLSINLLQRNTAAAEQVCERLEILLRRQPVPQSILKQLYPIFIPVGIPGIRSIRQRLLAALEENRLVHVPEKQKQSVPIDKKNKELQEEAAKEQAKYIENTLTLFSLVFDLYNHNPDVDPRRRLTDHQEWLLYRRLFHCAKELMGDRYSFTKVAKMLDVESFIEAVALPGKMSAHYRALKERFGRKESFKLRAAHIAGQILKTPSSAPSLSVTAPILGTEDERIKQTLAFAELMSSHNGNKARLEKLSKLLQNCSKEPLPDVSLSLETINREKFIQGFLTYYKIARSEGAPGQKEKLMKLFPLLKGGWDPETNQLLNYLELVANQPRLFWKSKDLEKALKDSNPHYISDDLRNFLGHLENRLCGYDTITGLGSIVGNLVLDKTISSGVAKDIPVLGQLPMASMLSPALYWGSKLYNVIKNAPKAPPLPAKTVHNHVSKTAKASFTHLEAEDRTIDESLQSLFSLAFEETRLSNQRDGDEEVALFDLNSNEAIERESVMRLNNSIRDFNARDDRQQVFLRFKGQDQLWNLYTNLRTCRDQLKGEIDGDLKQLLSTLNSVHASGNNPLRVTVEDLYRFFVDGNIQTISELSGLPVSIQDKLDQAVARHVARSTRLQQLERGLSQVEALVKVDPELQKNEFEKRVEQLADILKARRAYSFEMPSRLLRRLMIYELLANKMLWKKQIPPMQKLLLGRKGFAVLELLMGYGKTDVISPIIDAHEADGDQVVFNIWPTSMLGANVRQISTPSKKVFNQVTNVLHFSRGADYTPEHLEAIRLLIERAKERGETLNMTKEDAKAIELIFLDRQFQLENRSPTQQEQEMNEHLAAMLRTARAKGKVVGDEAHELFKDDEELNFPFGPRKTIKPSLYHIVETCMRHLSTYEGFLKMFRSEDAKGVDKLFADKIAPYIAEKMSRHSKFEIGTLDQRKEFIAFVLGRAEKVPSWIRQSSQYSEISMVKGLLTVLLPLTLQRSVNVDYGPSLKNGGEFARPYKGNKVCLEQSSIRDPYEAAVKTGLMLLQSSLTQENAQQVLVDLEEKMKQEIKLREVPAHQTLAFKMFQTLSGTNLRLDAMATWSQADRKSVENNFRHNPEAILFYMRQHIWKTMHYWQTSLRSDAQNFASMFHSRYDLTGTPYNDGVYPDEEEILWDPGTNGEALNVLSKKCPKDGVHVLRSTAPETILDEVLKDFFKPGSNFTALIDGGAQLRGLNNLQVARKMAEYAARHHPDIRAINFFMLDAQGLDQQMTLEIGAKDPIPYDRCTVPLSAQLTYFDQVHGFAANFSQKFNGKGMVLVGQNHMLYRLLQEVFRMRGIKEFKRLVKGEITQEAWEKLNLEQTQTIHFAMTEDTRKLISSGDEAPTLKEIVEFARKNEKVMAERNYNTYRRKAHNIVRSAVIDKVLASKNMAKTCQKAKNILLSHLEDDPKKLYGLIDKWIPTDQALEATRAHALNAARKTGLFTDQELQGLQVNLEFIRKPPMPETVHVYTDGENLHTHLLDNLGQEMHQENETENETETEQEQESELNQHSQNQLKVHPFTEWGWPEKLQARSVEWMKFDMPVAQRSSLLMQGVSKVTQLFRSVTKKTREVLPPLFRVSDLLTHAQLPILHKISKLFDQRLWVTNNFIPRVVRGLSEAPAEIGTQEQRELTEVLVHYKESTDGEVEIESVACLSLRDAAQWRKYLAQKQEQTDKEADTSGTKVMLWDTILRIPVAGDLVDLNTMRQNKDFQRLETQLKFLNGDSDYIPEHIPVLKEWIQQGKVEIMEEIYHGIHGQRKPSVSLSGSDIDHIFADIKNIPLAERI